MFLNFVKLGRAVFGGALLCVALFGQQTATAPSTQTIEFPAVMLRSMNAGKVAVGTKVEAKLVAATLANGVVIPRDAVLSGVITESVAGTKTDPSRLAIHMDSAQWKKGPAPNSAPINVYLTAWYYPEVDLTKQDLSYEPPDAANGKGKWNGMGTYPDPNNPVSLGKFPGRDSGPDTGPGAASPASSIAKHRVHMKNIESIRAADGSVTLSSQHSTIKLDRITTYVFASSDLLSKN